MKNTIALIQVWIGEFPEYFKYHLMTCETQKIDFFIFTDQEVQESHKKPNVRYFKITLSQVSEMLSSKLEKRVNIEFPYKLCDVKPAYPDLFYEFTKDYEFVGWYDIDTLFGDIDSWISPHLRDYDIVSFGEAGSIYDRCSGPLCLVRNVERIREIYKSDSNFYEALLAQTYQDYDDSTFTKTISRLEIPYKIIHESSNLNPINLKIEYDAVWTCGKVFVKEQEKLIYHFLKKNLTKLETHGNTIVAYYHKKYEDDFMWVTYLTKEYEPIAKTLFESIKKYSNRKCLVYTVNYTADLQYKMSDQFIIKRIDISKEGDRLDNSGRSFNTITAKPAILENSIITFPNKTFVFIDADSYITVSADCIHHTFTDLENYPISNSHVHDVIYLNYNNERINSLHQLGEELGIEICIFPRRKTNIMIYDYRSLWFFREQMQVYYDHKDSNKLGIFGFYDEDTLNVLLSKYRFTKCLPVVDIEERITVDVTAYYNYTYSMTGISEGARVPTQNREVYFIHGYKDPHTWSIVAQDYPKTVIDKEELIVYFNGKDIVFERNSFFLDKVFKNEVIINVYANKSLYFSANWEIFKTHFYYIWDIWLDPNLKYTIEIIEQGTNNLLYANELSV